MVMKELVQEVNADLKSLRQEAVSDQDNKLFLRLVDNLIRLTDFNDENKAQDSVEVQLHQFLPLINESQHEASEKLPPVLCPHKVLNVFGQCIVCGNCGHTQIADNNVCKTCGALITLQQFA